MKILKSIGAVLAGLAGGHRPLHRYGRIAARSGNLSGVGPAVSRQISRDCDGLSHRLGVAASYITARLAPDRPMQHALAGGFLGMVLAAVGAAVTWNKGPEFGPHWYPIALIVLALPCAWLGGTFYRRK